MIPTQDMTPFPVFSDNGTKVKPDDPKYSAGFQPGDVVPAEWLNWILNRASGASTKLNAGALSMEQEINNVLQAGGQTPDVLETDQLVTAIVQLITEATLVSEQLPAVGVPTLWMAAKPDWAIDFGNGAATQYLWANYPKLNNDKFKGILSTLSTAGWMTAYDATGFYVPDLRGVVPVGYGTNARRTAETLNGGGNVGAYLGSENKYHNHAIGVSLTQSSHSGRVADSFRPETASVSGIVSKDGTRSGRHNDTSSANNQWFKISFTTNVQVAGTSCSFSPSGATTPSKPATIGCMWIVRYE